MREVEGELTRELALKLTFIMWEDMVEAAKIEWELNQSKHYRDYYKRRWLADRGFCDSDGNCNVSGSCLLCQYVKEQALKNDDGMVHCHRYCPISWGRNWFGDDHACTCFNGDVDYRFTPVEEFLNYMKTHIKEVK